MILDSCRSRHPPGWQGDINCQTKWHFEGSRPSRLHVKLGYQPATIMCGRNSSGTQKAWNSAKIPSLMMLRSECCGSEPLNATITGIYLEASALNFPHHQNFWTSSQHIRAETVEAQSPFLPAPGRRLHLFTFSRYPSCISVKMSPAAPT